MEKKNSAAGRPTKADEVKANIEIHLDRVGMDTADNMRRTINRRQRKSYSWNTIHKYLEELVAEKKIIKHVPERPSRSSYKKTIPVYFVGGTMTRAVDKRIDHLLKKIKD